MKADDADIQERLRESMRNDWSGDVNLEDGLRNDGWAVLVARSNQARTLFMSVRSKFMQAPVA